MNNAYEIVEAFEQRIASFSGAPFAVAVDSCTNALFLCCKVRDVTQGQVQIPARTHISVPFAIMRAGGKVKFNSDIWTGIYELHPYDIWDSAKRFRQGMYQGGMYCLSFHSKKHLNIGKGGMILCENARHAALLKRLRYDGRQQYPHHRDPVPMMGYPFYMTPEQAARGLALMDVLPDPNAPDQIEDYDDLRKHPVFKEEQRAAD